MGRFFMRCFIVLISLSILYPLNIAAVILPVPQVYQDPYKNNWCWAAGSQAVLSYYGTEITQTVIAAYGTPGEADAPNLLFGQSGTRNGVDRILSRFGNIYSQGNYWALEQNQVVGLINTLTPVPIGWSGADHIVVIMAAEYDSTGTLYLGIMDPSAGTSWQRYDWVSNGGGHTWTHSLIINTKLITSAPKEYVSKSEPFLIELPLSPIEMDINSGALNTLPNLFQVNPDWDGVSLHSHKKSVGSMIP